MKKNTYNNLNTQAHLALTALSALRYTHKKNQVLRQGNDLTIVTTDQNETECLLAAVRLDREAIHAKVVSLDAAGNPDCRFLQEASQTGMVFIVNGGNKVLASILNDAFSNTDSAMCHTIQLEQHKENTEPTKLYQKRANDIYEQIVNAA